MKPLKLILDQEEDDEIPIGLIRLSKHIPDHEFFFHVNQLNPFSFKRIADYKKEGTYYDYFFPRFEAYSRDEKTCIHILANRSSESFQKNDITELFSDEESSALLLNLHEDVDFIIKTSDSYQDFSLILLPENFAFQIQELYLNDENELYHLFQYYE